jgi:hypothetical protein
VAIAWNVIYHSDGEPVQRAINEIRRVLVPGGIYVGTMLSRRNAGFGIGRRVAPDTFVVDGADTDKAHPTATATRRRCFACTAASRSSGFAIASRCRPRTTGSSRSSGWRSCFSRLSTARPLPSTGCRAAGTRPPPFPTMTTSGASTSSRPCTSL